MAKVEGDSVAWVMDAAQPLGEVALLLEKLTCGRPASMISRDGALATSWEMRSIIADGPMDRAITGLSDTPPVATNCGISNDYAGLAYAADGSLWGAWSDSRGSAMPRIAVAQLA